MSSVAAPRRYFRISLRVLLLSVTLCALCLGFLARGATRQRDLASSLATTSSTAYYDFQLDDEGDIDPTQASPWPRWLVAALGIDLLHHVTWLHLEGPEVTDETLRSVAQLPRLRTLHLNKTGITEAGLQELAKMRSLRTLTLQTQQVSDATVALAAEMPELREFEVYSALVTDASLDSLGRARHLERLWFEDTDVTEEGLERFRAAHPRCRAGYSSPGFKTVAWRPPSAKPTTASAAAGEPTHEVQ